jgi:hypothetical protein
MDVTETMKKTNASATTIAINISTKDKELIRFIEPMKTILKKEIPEKTQYKTVVFTPSNNAINVDLEILEFTGNKVIKFGTEVLKVAVTAKSSNQVLGKATISAGYIDDEVSLGGSTSLKVSGYSSEEVVSAKRTSQFLSDFLNGTN